MQYADLPPMDTKPPTLAFQTLGSFLAAVKDELSEGLESHNRGIPGLLKKYDLSPAVLTFCALFRDLFRLPI